MYTYGVSFYRTVLSISYVDRSNININDVLGDYMLTLVDTLDTLAVSGIIKWCKLKYPSFYMY